MAILEKNTEYVKLIEQQHFLLSHCFSRTMYISEQVILKKNLLSLVQIYTNTVGADLHYHKFCLETYLQKYKRQSHQSDAKHRALTKGKTIEENKAPFPKYFV